jgi:DNA adenine methylase
VNKKGIFNVPMGSYKNPLICDECNLAATSALLKNITIKCGDYKECLNFIDNKTFVYIDPPYRPITQTANFTSYTKKDFLDKDQKELRCFVESIAKKQAKFLISNSDPKDCDDEDTFFDDLYKSYKIVRVNAKRMINCKGKNRGNVKELVISNY